MPDLCPICLQKLSADDTENKDNFQTRHTILIIILGIGLKNVSEKGS